MESERDENLKKLDEYISSCLLQGMSKSEIKQELSACGWTEDCIEGSFNFLKNEKREVNIKKFLKIIDELLAKLPDKVKEDFIYSKDFEVYKNVLEKYNIKK